MDRNSLHFPAILFFALVLSGCGGPDKADRKLPSQGETCNGTAIQNRYLVFYNNGEWEVVEDDDRENFKNSFVAPRVDDIKFIEYDQVVLTRDTNAEIEAF